MHNKKRNDMKKIFFLLLTLCLTTGFAEAVPKQRVPAYRGVIERVQPNGDTLLTYLRGDERKHWMMTVDGWQIAENRRGRLCYMMRNCHGDAVVSRKTAHNAADRKRCERRWLERYGIKKEIVRY